MPRRRAAPPPATRAQAAGKPSRNGDQARAGNWLGPVLELGRRQSRIGAAIGVTGALLSHGSAIAHGAAALTGLWTFAEKVDARVAARTLTTVDIDVQPPASKPEPEPEPEPELEPPTPKPVEQPRPQTPEPTEAPPPEAAEAGKLLTAEPDPNEPIDLTGEGFVTGDGTRYAGGITASTGTSKTAVRDRRARPDGVRGGRGTART